MKSFFSMVLVWFMLMAGASMVLTDRTMAQGLAGSIPAYPNGQVTETRDNPPYMEIVTGDDIAAVYDYYKSVMTQSGWAINGDFPDPGVFYQLLFVRGDQRLSLGIVRMDDGQVAARFIAQP